MKHPIWWSWLTVIAVVALCAAAVWSSDAITLKGHRTVYTAECQQGQWHGPTCTGRLVAGRRYRFLALRAHSEVIFWTGGATDEPSGKLTGCAIADGRNWSCPASSDASRAITLRMQNGLPVADAAGPTQPFHAIEKWRWWLLHWGIPAGSDADN